MKNRDEFSFDKNPDRFKEWKNLIDNHFFDSACDLWLRQFYPYPHENQAIDLSEIPTGDDGVTISYQHALVAMARYLGYRK